MKFSGLGGTNIWWGSLLGELFLVRGMHNVCPMGQELASFSLVEKTLLTPQKSVKRFIPLVWLSPHLSKDGGGVGCSIL